MRRRHPLPSLPARARLEARHFHGAGYQRKTLRGGTVVADDFVGKALAADEHGARVVEHGADGPLVRAAAVHPHPVPVAALDADDVGDAQ